MIYNIYHFLFLISAGHTTQNVVCHLSPEKQGRPFFYRYKSDVWSHANQLI